MASQESHLDTIEFIETPAAKPQPPASTATGVRTTDYPCIKNAPLPADGPGARHFSNGLLFSILLGVPFFINYKIGGSIWTYLFFFLITGLPLLVSFWAVVSAISPRINDDCKLPGRPVEYYLEFHDPALAKKYSGNNKIPYETFHELYFDNKVSMRGDALDILEYRHDFMTFNFTWGLFKFFLLSMIPEIIFHTQSQDEEQVREHYDRGDDFYAWFLGPRMIYTSGVISDINKAETLEQMQDNKLRIVCEKAALKQGEEVLDIGCGWGTLARFASQEYGVNVTGITLGKNQTAYGNKNLAKDGIPTTQSRILCMDYRDIPLAQGGKKKYDKIISLEMVEHVGVKNLGSFCSQVYDMLEDDGTFVLQYSGLRKHWQYEDLNWGLFMNKYIFPGADASTPLSFFLDKMEGAGFETVSIDNIGVHYSSTLWSWYRNWMGNKDKVINKYGVRWFRIWEFFLASSVITSRQGGAAAHQYVFRKNINKRHAVEDIPTHWGLKVPQPKHGNNWLPEGAY
ncbi:S-adenosyl-L-methionine-dependent methyltransferase [Yarrowia lipolytica]|uniref:sphingolipid C(9)-methyltransferase n=2 Tax=Yarrowia lipolytica TaxID=4952 RepID=Q6CB68_YARLI|nr:YALI0C21494p [Yarrowia lipolytica CLIB122]AOW03205.1 hypothetical protein YALI1_C29648g [Yarrowia lipolytica]KAB8281148.1 S-adenosyl-L-methionine-dependent methyltransferase [Yarrowia lipolytica]KAE8172987.1 S-adenosyl-L-methionine-dependent methyltransferase [Yarrowia lipolytica]KAJ8053704.1 S-adenosyl-L-methionine-dependent methyltransferase [Yarrowia lipolytica]QNP95966.1 Sphingolipid C9-methyltransferase [Yarrowia lipolytica]|eukprot:XP_502094.1 YALI0C21494p [Yarrowia lipolytica CLIB122]